MRSIRPSWRFLLWDCYSAILFSHSWRLSVTLFYLFFEYQSYTFSNLLSPYLTSNFQLFFEHKFLFNSIVLFSFLNFYVLLSISSTFYKRISESSTSIFYVTSNNSFLDWFQFSRSCSSKFYLTPNSCSKFLDFPLSSYSNFAPTFFLKLCSRLLEFNIFCKFLEHCLSKYFKLLELFTTFFPNIEKLPQYFFVLVPTIEAFRVLLKRPQEHLGKYILNVLWHAGLWKIYFIITIY